ncbi:MAG TPA: ATP-binding protein [Gaiellaceae bacterium]|nr:ATP-binding protein [Gaiellaceae bacterium]
MVKLIGRRRGPPEARLDAERAHVLVEESREIVVVLDGARRVVAASRRARESLEGLVEGATFPDELLHVGSRTPLEIPYEVDGRKETLLYLSGPGDLAAYEELRAGFTAAVSHELRTPLARLLALLESALLPGADHVDLIEQARGEVERIGELIDDVLFLSELESGRAVVALGSIRVLPVLEQVVGEARDRAERAGIELRVDCTASFELPLRARMLQVVAENLVENAIRYAGAGATCTISCAERDGVRSLAVADDGAGVDEDELPRLFERFYRADHARSTVGTGLGLAIVKHVVAAAGGAVEAYASPGGGLTVGCTFPSRL